MRIWADVYDTNGNKLTTGSQMAIKSLSVSDQLDAASPWSASVALEERALDTLDYDQEVRVYVQVDDVHAPREVVRGILREINKEEKESGPSFSMGGSNSLDALTEETVGLGCVFNETAIQTVVNNLAGLKSGWSAVVDSDIAGDLMTARFDGVHLFKAIKRITEEKGVHFRSGTAPKTVEVGAFGTSVLTPNGLTVRAEKLPSTVGDELLTVDEVIGIASMSVKGKSRDLINWAIPMGAGEGIAATTLRDTTYNILNEDGTTYRSGARGNPTYPIYRRVNAYGVVEYYIDASGGAGKRKKVVSFKDIGPVANSDLAKRLASDALADACIAWLQRMREVLVSYRFSAKKVHVNVRAGDKIRVRYKGFVDVLEDEQAGKKPYLTYINLDRDMWVMKVSKTFSESGEISHDFEVNTIDRHVLDETRILVDALEMMQAQNVGIKTTVWRFQDSDFDTIQGVPGSSGNSYKEASFEFIPDNTVTDLAAVFLNFKTKPLWALTQPIAGYLINSYYYDVYTGYNYPSYVSLWINGVDVSADYGGPWNNSGENTPLDVTCDISNLITEASGGIYQTHTIVLKAGGRAGEVRLNTSFVSQSGNASQGIVKTRIRAQGTARALLG
jgi:hypothetical protein